MRRIVVAGLGTVSSIVLLFAYPTSRNVAISTSGAPALGAAASAGAIGASASPTTGSGRRAVSASHAYTGQATQTRWGVVQVRITVQGGKITGAEAVQYPNDNGHSQEINAYALPILAQEVLKAQSASIDAVSGATVTSGGYLTSLQSAVDAAHL